MNREELHDLVDANINDIFLRYQDAMGIRNGDISPEYALKLDQITDQLTDLVIDSMEHNKSEVLLEDFLRNYDKELHKIYYMMQAYWYGSNDAKDRTVTLDQSYEAWAADWYYDLCGLGRAGMEKEIRDTIMNYQRNIKEEIMQLYQRDEDAKNFDAQTLCDLYNASDIEALNYMHRYLDGEDKALCERLIYLNGNTQLGWGERRATSDESEEYINGKWKLLNHFGIESSYGDAVLSPQSVEEKLNKLTGCEYIASLPQDWQDKIEKAITSELKELYDTNDMDVRVEGSYTIRHLVREAMDGKLTDLEDNLDWRDLLRGGDGHYKARDEEEREI